jgi:UDPglucose 6-dehydrogenase
VRIGVVGLWHLGFVYAACLAELGHDVIAYDPDVETIKQAQQSKFPVQESGLAELISGQMTSGQVSFTNSLEGLCETEIIWVTHDVPVDVNDRADLGPLDSILSEVIGELSPKQVLVVSSQVPVGYCRQKLAEAATQGKRLLIGYSPENLRLGQSLDAFKTQITWAIGADSDEVFEAFNSVFEAIPVEIVDCAIETAEMIKHGLNSLLALNVTFGNELGRVCSAVGADGIAVAKFLRTDPRVGNRAYILPGGPISGGTLLRDVQYLSSRSPIQGFGLPVMENIWQSNRIQQEFIIKAIVSQCLSSDEPVVIVGLAYKEGSSATRQSMSLSLVAELMACDKDFVLFDPLVKSVVVGGRELVVMGSISLAIREGGNVVLLTPPSDGASFRNEIGRKSRTIFDVCGYPDLKREPISGLKIVGVNDL